MKTIIITLLAIAIIFDASAQNIGINLTGAPADESAILDLSASNKGFLITRADTANITSPAFGLMTMAPSDSCLYMYSGLSWKGIGGTGVRCAQPQPYVHPCSIDNTTKIVDVTSITGAVWMDRNLGASKKATSITDVAAYGDLYQWGRCKDGHEKRTSGTTPSLSTTDKAGHGDFITSTSNWRNPQNNNFWQEGSGINNPCPAGYRVPTQAEAQAEIATYPTYQKNAESAFASPLKLTTAGWRKGTDGSLVYENTSYVGAYWTSTIYDATNAVFLTTEVINGFNNGNAGVSIRPKSTGQSVRCIKEYVCGKDHTTKVVEVTSPATSKKWMDRNLGASQVATSSADINAYGDLYQWGRCHDGHQKRTSATTPIKSLTENPGHNKFITTNAVPNDWRSTEIVPLWQGSGGINNPCPAGYRLPTNLEFDAEILGVPQAGADAIAFGSFLKLPVAGFRSLIGDLADGGSAGYYWTSTVSGIDANFLFFNSGTITVTDNSKAYGASIRCIKN